MTTIVRVSGTMTDSDGCERDFQITSDGYIQWGAAGSILGNSVDALSAMHEALADADLISPGA